LKKFTALDLFGLLFIPPSEDFLEKAWITSV